MTYFCNIIKLFVDNLFLKFCNFNEKIRVAWFSDGINLLTQIDLYFLCFLVFQIIKMYLL